MAKAKRNRKGQFVKARKKAKRKKTRTKVVYRAAPKRRRRKSVAKRKRKRSSPRRSRPRSTRIEEKAKVAAAGAALGYIETETEWMTEGEGGLPILGEMGSGTKGFAAIALAAHFGAKKLKSPWLDRLSQAASGIAGYKFAKADFELSGGDGNEWDRAMSGNQATELSGKLSG